MQIQVDKRNTNIVYTGYQFGNYLKCCVQLNPTRYVLIQLNHIERIVKTFINIHDPIKMIITNDYFVAFFWKKIISTII